MPIVSKEISLRSRVSRVLTALVILICAVTEVGMIIQGDVRVLVQATGPLLLIGFGAYILFWAPVVRISPAHVTVVNPFRTFVVTWPAIQDIQTRWGLTLITATTKVTAWASPAPSRHGSVRRIRRDAYGRPDFAAEQRQNRPADMPNSVATITPMLVTKQWEEYRDAGLLDTIEGVGLTSRWHTVTFVISGILILATVAGFAIR